MKIILAPAFVVMLIVPAMAEETVFISTGSLTLKEALAEARERSPEILAARKFWEALASRPVGAAAPENPRLDIERMYASGGRNIITGAEEKNFMLSQEIPFPAKLHLRKRVALKAAAMAEQGYLAKIRDVLARVRSIYAMLYLSHKNLELFNENIELLRRFAKVAESKYAAGRASQSDVLKAHVELSKMLNMLVVVNQDKEAAGFMLNALLGRAPESALGVPVDLDSKKLDYSLDELERQALQSRPQLLEAALGVERAAGALSLARSEFFPDFMLQYRQRRDSMRGSSQDAMIGFTIPLWFWKPAAMAAEAKSELQMFQAQLQATRLMTLSEVRASFVRARTSQRLIELYRNGVLAQAEGALKVVEASYQADKASFLDLVDGQRAFLNFKLEYYQYIAEYEQRLAELERAVGKELL